MTSSDGNEHADRVLDRVLGMLAPDEVNRLIDSPIDLATGQMPQTQDVTLAQAVFDETIATVVRHIYEHGIRVPKFLTLKAALSEAILLLNRYYRNDKATGYEGALYDACEFQQAGRRWDPSTLVEIVKEQERQLHRDWVYVSELDHESWQTQCDIVRAIVARFRPFLPEDVTRCPVERLVRCIPHLVDVVIESDRFLAQIWNPSPLSTWDETVPPWAEGRSDMYGL